MAIIRVLLLENNPEVTELIGLSLTEGGIEFELVHVNDRDEFQQALEQEQFNIVLADYTLSSFDGISALETTRAAHPTLPFICLSEVPGEEIAVEVLQAGAADYVLKQRLERLPRAVRRALQETDRSQPFATEASQPIVTAAQPGGGSTQQGEIDTDYLLAIIALRLRQSLDLDEILETAVVEVRQLLQADRTIIYRFEPDWSAIVKVESVAHEQWSIAGSTIPSAYFRQEWLEEYRRGNAKVIDDIYQAGLEQFQLDFLTQIQVRASLVVPIPQGSALWGLLIVHQCLKPRHWLPSEVGLLERLAPQLAINIHQSMLLERSLTELAERRHMEARLRHNALHDVLTDLPNRALFMDRLERAIERAKRTPNGLFAVLFMDLDRFKLINDSLGHTIGDQLLIAVAERLQPCLRGTDTISRFGGDEFVILLEDLESPNAATRIAERVQQELRLPFNLSGYTVVTSASIGVVLSNTTTSNPEDILRDADSAMYFAKTHGKAQYTIFNVSMRDSALTRLQLEADLRQALEDNEFYLLYQPIKSLPTDEIVGFEALIRWLHPIRGIVSPLDFIPLAEETGLIIPIGEWVLRQACQQLRRWHLQFPENQTLTISVNISSIQIEQPNLIEQIERILRETGLSSSCLKLEITESAFMGSMEAACTTLAALRQIGVQVYIDDFGTGYASFSYLQSLPIDTIKIDRSFINRMGNDDKSMQIVQTIVALAENMNMGIIAEGIETIEQMQCFESMGQSLVQGYLISRPLDSIAAEAFIAQAQES